MSTDFLLGVSVASARRSLVSMRFADRALKAAARFWFVITVVASVLFAFAVAAFYGLTAMRGDMVAWSRHLSHGYVTGDTAGNLAVITHLASAVVILVAGVIQMIPRVRVRFPVLHRWNGRLYILAAVTLTTAGLYMTWVLGSVGDVYQHLGLVLHAVIIWVCAFMAVRSAIARDFAKHRRWALRLFLVMSASLFIRAILFLSFVIFRRPFGFDPFTFTGPFLTFTTFAQYLIPLAVVELYFRAQQRPGALRRLAMAGGLTLLTVAMGVGLFAAAAATWVPGIKAGFDSRKSIAQIMLGTIAAGRTDQAIEQYRALKASAPAAYNFDEVQLNTLGHQLLHAKKFKEAIRIFQLNVEAYPQSRHAYNSLGTAYLEAGDTRQAIANFRKSLQQDANDLYAIAALHSLGADR